MKRSPLRPGLKPLTLTPLSGSARTPARQPHKPLRAKAKNGKTRFRKRRCRPFLDWLKQQPCCITGKLTGQWLRLPRTGELVQVWVDPAHVRGRALGGDDLFNAVPLSRHLHDELHTKGPEAFHQKYRGLNLVRLACDYTERFLSEWGDFMEAAHA